MGKLPELLGYFWWNGQGDYCKNARNMIVVEYENFVYFQSKAVFSRDGMALMQIRYGDTQIVMIWEFVDNS